MTAPEAVLPGGRFAVVRASPLAVVCGAMVAAALVLGAAKGWQSLAQATINGLVSGSYFALGAAGLTPVFGVLKLVNLAHRAVLTFGADMALLGHSTLSPPFPGAVVFRGPRAARVAGALAGLAGIVYGASVGVVTPNLGFEIVLSLFAAVIVGGIGNAYGALAGGILIGLVQEWATLVAPASIKVAVGFGAMILVLIL